MLKSASVLSFRLIFASSILTTVYAQEAPQKSHEHQGKLSPYVGEPPEIVLDENESKLLASGQAVFKKLALKNAKRGLAIFRVNADAKTIWSVIKDFKAYPEWIAGINKTEIYKREARNIYVKFIAGGSLLRDTTWYAIHDYPQDNMEDARNWGTWKLDYEHRSDFDDSVGFWRVVPVASDSGKSDVIYSTDLRLKGFFVALFEASLINNSLKNATQWVKVQAEAQASP